MKLKSVLFSLLLFYVNYIYSQEYKNVESNNIRIDPEWVISYLTGNVQSLNIKVDKYGNIYSSGYFRSKIEINSTKTVLAKPNDYVTVTFLMKHNNDGKLLWLRTVDGHTQPTKVVIDNKGSIFVVGNFQGNKLCFNSIDTSKVIMSITQEPQYGLFFCKYDTSGKVLFAQYYNDKDKEGIILDDFTYDNENNFYVGGNYNYNGNSAKRSYFLLKFDHNFNFLWKQKGGIKGQSFIKSIFIDVDNNVNIAGTFKNTIEFENNLIQSKHMDNNIFIAQFNSNGKFKWFCDSIGQYRKGIVNSIVCDKKGNRYVYGGNLVTSSFLAKINKKGSIDWLQTAVGEKQQTEEQLIIDEQNNIYLCGESRGAVFSSKESNFLSFKEKGKGLDFFIAKYDENGSLKWMKAGGGLHDDICNSIALYKNDLFTVGRYGPNILFREKELSSSSGSNIWLAKFNKNKLESTESNQSNKSGESNKSNKSNEVTKSNKSNESNQNNKPNLNNKNQKNEVDNTNCECTSTLTNPTNSIPSPVNRLLPYDIFQKISGWKQIGDDNIYDKLYYCNRQNSFSDGSLFESFTAISSKPIRFLHPQKYFGINFTPCLNEKKSFEMPIEIAYSQPIKSKIPDFDYSKFDFTAKSYFEMLNDYSQASNMNLIEILFLNYNQTDLNDLFTKINKKYLIDVKLNKDNLDESLKSFTTELKRKNIKINDLFVSEFVLSEASPHRVNDIEKERLVMIFKHVLAPNLAFDDIDKLILLPQFDAKFAIKKLGIEISDKVIRRWDLMKNKPAVDLKGNYIQSQILLSIPNFEYSNFSGIKIFIGDICFTKSEISGTNILFSFNKGYLVEAKEGQEFHINERDYPLLITDTIKGHSDIPTHYKYDTLIENFSGLWITDAVFNIPFKDRILTTQGKNIIFNNYFISGIIEITINPISSDTPDKFTILLDDKQETFTTKDITKIFERCNLKQIKIEKISNRIKDKVENKIKIYFCKKSTKL